jgi:DNA (cytosine-5)-methyltransferase 1
MKFIDLFSGIGGFHLGFSWAGHECVGWCEIDKFARRSYEAMHETKGLWNASDIREVNPSDLPDADIYTFGFPCQSFSIGGKRGGFQDTRGTLFFEVMRLAEIRKPKYLVAENVEGLLSHDGGQTFEVIINTMAELGYGVEWQVLDSKYFGVPQDRERVYIVGHLGGFSGREVFPFAESSGPPDGVQRQTTGTIGARSGEANTVGTYIVESNVVPQGKVKQVGTRTEYGGSPRTQDRVYDPTGLAPTLNTNGGGNREVKIVASDTRIRKLTPREYFRLQGFPDEYFDKAAAVCSDSQLYKQAGNSVTVPVIYEIAKRIPTHLTQ